MASHSAPLPTPTGPAPVEGKVNAQAIGHYVGMTLAAFLLWLLGVLVWHQPVDAQHAVQAAAAVPAPVIGLVALIPGGLGYLCGYMAKHSWRVGEDTTELAAEIAAGVAAHLAAQPAPSSPAEWDYPDEAHTAQPAGEAPVPA